MKLRAINETFLYHGTNEYNLQDILSDGYLDVFPPDYGTEQDVWPDGEVEERSYWTPSESTTQYFFPEEGTPVILRTVLDRRFKKEGTGDWYSNDRIPVSDLEAKVQGQWVPLASLAT